MNSSSNLGARKFIYGLPELNREEIKQAHNIANPGCFATCISLSLLPLAASKILPTVHITGITGSTGAGNSLTESAHFLGGIIIFKPTKHLLISIMQK